MSTPEMKYSGKKAIRMTIFRLGRAWVTNANSIPRPKANKRPRVSVATHCSGLCTDMSKPYQAKPNTIIAYTVALMQVSTSTRAIYVSRGLICL
ncbi:hypothetical protein D3C77_538590 [compost metagenome]